MTRWIKTSPSEKIGALKYEWTPKHPKDLNICLDIGQRITLLEKCAPWYYAATSIGTSWVYFIIPYSYVKIIPCLEAPSKSCALVYYENHLISQLIRDVMYSWISAMRTSSTQVPPHRIISLMTELTSIRRNISDPTYNVPEEHVVKLLNEGNSIFDFEYIPYFNNKFVHIGNSRLKDIFDTHDEAKFESTMNIYQESTQDQTAGTKRVTEAEEYFVVLSIEKISYEQIDPTAWVFGIYDNNLTSYVTEKYIYNIYDQMTKDAPFKPKTVIFKLTKTMACRSLHLFIKSFRFAPFTGEKRAENHLGYKRPLATAGLNITDILQNYTKGEIRDKLQIYNLDDMEFGGFENMFSSNVFVSKLSTSSSNYIEFGLTVYVGTFQNLKMEHPNQFDANNTVIPYLGLPDTLTPDHFQNDFYITLRSASFEKVALKGKSMNVEATVSAWNASGRNLTESIRIGYSDAPILLSEYRTAIVYHHNVPEWNETIGFSLPDTALENVRILIVFSHISSSPGKSKNDKVTILGYTIVRPQTNDHTVLGQVEWMYYIKKFESNQKTQNISVTDDARKLVALFKENFSVTECPTEEAVKYNIRDAIKIKFHFYSTVLTYLPEVYTIKEFRKQNPNNREMIFRIQYTESSEIIKFICPLFRNIVQNLPPIDPKGENIVFYLAFNKIISVISEKRLCRFLPSFNDAISTTIMPQFWKNVFQHLKFAVSRITNVSNRTEYETIKVFFECSYLIFKVIIKSYQDFQAENANSSECLITSLIEFFNDLVSTFALENTQHLFPLQVKMLTSFPVIIDHVNKILSDSDTILLVSTVLEQTPNTITVVSNSETRINSTVLHKLKFLKRLALSEKFISFEFRANILPNIMSSVATMIRQDPYNMEMCVEIADLIMNIVNFVDEKFNLIEIKSIICHVVKNFIEMNQFDVPPILPTCTEIPTLNCLLSLIAILPEFLFKFCFNQDDPKEDKEKFKLWYGVFSRIFARRLFPASHVVTWLGVCRELLKITQYFSDRLKIAFSSPDTSDVKVEMMHNFFNFALEFINYRSLDSYNILNIYLIEYVYGYEDMRITMANIMFQMWQVLNRDNIAHLYDYAQILVTTSLINIFELRSVIFHILYDFLIHDYLSTGNMDRVTRIIISYIDSDTYTVDKYKVFAEDFKKITDGLWSKCDKEPIKEVGLKSSRQILDIIDTLTYYSIPEKFEECTFLHALRALQMIEFHTKISHSEMIQNNIARLLNYNEIMEAHTEAALCYVKLSEYCSWDEFELAPRLGKFRPEAHRVRKETFLKKAIELFDRDFFLEMAVDACHKLLPLYEKYKIDYISASKIYADISSFYQRIAKGESCINTYYRFAFVGLDFPESIRNKSFICHMGSCASLGVAMGFVKKQFPNAVIPMTSTFDENLRNTNLQYIYVQVVKPIASDKENYERLYVASEPISRFLKMANVLHFVSTTTVENKNIKNDQGQPTSTCVKILYDVTYPLPSTMIISNIKNETKTIMSDFEQIYELITTSTNELLDVCRNHELNNTLIKEIQMKSSGSLNAFVNGGLSIIVPKYFSDSYLLENPGSEENIELLQFALQKFMGANARALKILVKFLSDSMAAFIINLVDSYQSMRDLLELKANVTSEDLAYLISETSGQNTTVNSGYNSVKQGSLTTNSTNISDANSQNLVPTNRKNTVTSVDAPTKIKEIPSSYNTMKLVRGVKALSKFAAHDDDKSRSMSVKTIDKATIGDSKEFSSSGTLAAPKSKKKYSIFHSKK